MRISSVGAGESAGCWCAKGVVVVSNGRCYGDVTVNVLYKTVRNPVVVTK